MYTCEIWFGKETPLLSLISRLTNKSLMPFLSFCVFCCSMHQVGPSPLRSYWVMTMGQRRKSRRWGKQATRHPPKPTQLHWLTQPWPACLPDCPPLTCAVSQAQLRVTAALTTPGPVSMATPFLWKLSSQKLGFFLVSFGFIWGMMLLHFTIQQRASHENSAVLRQQILDLSKRYIKALAEENQSVMDGPYVGTMTAYGEYPVL